MKSDHFRCFQQRDGSDPRNAGVYDGEVAHRIKHCHAYYTTFHHGIGY